LAARTASGERVAISAASSSAAARGSSATRVTSPSSEACSPEIRRAVKVNSLATSTPTSRGSARVIPMSGTSPQRASITDSVASGAAIRMSAPRAICRPPPKQLPWIAAITGTGTSPHPVETRWAKFAGSPSGRSSRST
jgi:hypothetical protein